MPHALLLNTAVLLCVILCSMTANASFAPNGTEYWFNNVKMYHQEARTYCRTSRENGDMCCPHTAEKNSIINNARISLGGDFTSIWIGLQRYSGSTPWYWLSGVPLTYTNWHDISEGIPITAETAVAMYTSGTWRDWGLYTANNYTHSACCERKVCDFSMSYTNTSTNLCEYFTVCNATSYSKVSPNTTSDRVCTPFTVLCDFTYQYDARTSLTSDRVCKNISLPCQPSMYQSAAPTQSSDRQCKNPTVCDSSSQYQIVAPTITTDRVCTNATVCSSAQFESKPVTATSNRECTPATTCNSTTHYIKSALTATSDRVCAPYAVTCEDEQFEQAPPSLTSDRVCADITPCPVGTYQTADPTVTSNTLCASIKVCNALSQYQIAAPTVTSDRQCANASVCTATQYESPRLSATSDRTCRNATACNLSVQYESAALTSTADRRCTYASNCSAATEYMYAQLTPTSDRVCKAFSPCTAFQYEFQAPSATSDRVCRAIPICPTGTYLTSSGANTPLCAYHTNCTSQQFESKAPTNTSDRQCQGLTVCVAGWQPILAATATSDRVCAQCPAGTIDSDLNGLTECTSCPAGYYVPMGASGSCSSYACPIGQTDHDQRPATPCVACGSGTYVPAGSLLTCAALSCAPGTVDQDLNSQTACVLCGPGTYVPTRSTGACALYACPAGTIDDDNSASTPCKQCDPGTYVSAGNFGSCSVRVCAAGYTDDDSDPSTPCVACQSGTYVPTASSGACSKYLCPAGKFDHDASAVTACVTCLPGYFQNMAGAQSCKAVKVCSAGEFAITLPTTSTDRVCGAALQNCAEFTSSSRTGCLVCDAGFFLSNSLCFACSEGFKCVDGLEATVCPAGTFQNMTGQSSCMSCNFGSVQPSTGQTSCVPCTGASYLPTAQPATSCMPMTSGYYGVTTADADGYIQQSRCNLGHKCNNGTMAPCPPGTYQNAAGSSSCVACSVGTYSSTVARTSVCDQVANGHYLDADRRTDLGVCPAGSYCVDGILTVCAAGTYQDKPGQSSCIPCGDASYISFSGRDQPCLRVPEGYFGVGGTDKARTDIASCTIGNYCASGVQKPCAVGTYQPNPEQTSCIKCVSTCASGLTWNGTCSRTTGESSCFDVTAPVVSLVGGEATTWEAGVAFVDAGASADDSYEGVVAVTISGRVDITRLGVYTVTYSASDSRGNKATATRSVSVVDTTAPVITLLGSAYVTVSQFATYTDAGATISDSFDPRPTLTIAGGSVDTSRPGNYSIIYMGSDQARNAADPVTRMVTVVDAQIEQAAMSAAQAKYKEVLAASGGNTTYAAEEAYAVYAQYGGHLEEGEVDFAATSAPEPSSSSSNSSLVIGVIVGGVVLVIVAVVLVVYVRRQAKPSQVENSPGEAAKSYPRYNEMTNPEMTRNPLYVGLGDVHAPRPQKSTPRAGWSGGGLGFDESV